MTRLPAAAIAAAADALSEISDAHGELIMWSDARLALEAAMPHLPVLDTEWLTSELERVRQLVVASHEDCIHEIFQVDGTSLIASALASQAAALGRVQALLDIPGPIDPERLRSALG